MDVFGKRSEERLRELVSARIGDSLLIAISNRDPTFMCIAGRGLNA